MTLSENTARTSPEKELFILSERYINVQNKRHDLLSNGSTEDAVKARAVNSLQKHPDDNLAQHMLMQNYFQLKDSLDNRIACANNYQNVHKSGCHLNPSLR